MKFLLSGVTLLPKLQADAHNLKQLPLTLYNKYRTTAAGYSKVSRGLRFPLEIPGLYTRKKFSGDSSSGQWRSRYTIHASRHSTDKVLRSYCYYFYLEVDEPFLFISIYHYMDRTISYSKRVLAY